MSKEQIKYDMKLLQKRFDNYKKELQEQENKKIQKKRNNYDFRK